MDWRRTPARDATSPDRLVRRGLKFNHLRLVAKLGETNQVSAAAGQLALSQPAASRLLAELEQIVEAPLYQRHARGIVLTQAGLALVQWARKVLDDLDHADREIGEMASGVRGTVSIGSVTGPALELVLPVLRQARVTHPGITIDVSVDTSDKLAELLLARKLDFYVGRIPQELDHSHFAAEPIGPEPVSLVVRDGHPLMRPGRASIEACIAYDWVLQPVGSLLRHAVETYLLERRLQLPERIVSTSSTLMTLAIISQSNAIAPLARAAIDFFAGPEGLGAKLCALPVAEELAVSSYSVLRSSNKPLSPASDTLWSFICERARRLQSAGGA
ncbi:LysR substrate-binding domain-containing protein [Neoaquamicrobium sediminum]|uniref:LysR substrate-binding domain-containing protein n=1 Tax=Neoaquamicrobium sediminum TaxID=1849104 RepID=UPI001564A063|nr:LysR substrate-binding domain-containing protein [Mesorhizobium sediminum]NRC56357.1 LysR family transcriptional regulator [Mesorhizobium sediminum]